MSEKIPDQSESKEPMPAEMTKAIYVKRTNGEVTEMRVVENSRPGEDGKVLAYIIEQDEENGKEYIAGYKPVSERAMSDEVQSLLAAEYAASNRAENFENSADILLGDVQKKISGKSIELSTGIVDPSAVNESAQNFTREEIKSMREAARALVDEEPIIESKPGPTDVLHKLTEGLSENDIAKLRSYAEAIVMVRDAQGEGRGEDSTYWQQSKGQTLRSMSPKAQSVANRFAGYYNSIN